MSNPDSNRTASLTLCRSFLAILEVLLMVALVFTAAQAQTNSIERTESMGLHTGDLLLVWSSRESLQVVEVKGNMSAARLISPARYPADSLSFSSDDAGSYSLRLTFSYPSQYNVTISVSKNSGTNQEKSSYYLSSGQLLLTIDLDFKAPEQIAPTSSPSVWDSFTGWTTRFGDAFPLWVKLLYALLGVQFMVVGYKWIKFESRTREDRTGASQLDGGNLLFLWSEIVWKFLLTAFLAIAAVMTGQLVLLSLLRFMFLAQVNMLSLWDLFTLGFAGGIACIAYAFKLVLEKSFDLKPLFQE